MKSADNRRKVLFDTDIGSDIDDALALAYLLCEPRCELVGITTVTGEAYLRAEMASAMCRHVGRDDIPIHVGCHRALLGRLRQEQAPQAAALGARDRRRFAADNTAIEFMRRTIRANPGEITLLAVGPMTNLALLFATDPEIPALLQGLVLMCGRFQPNLGGEWNAFNDAFATAITYGSATHARPPRHVSYGLDVTTKVRLSADECRRRFTTRVLEPVRDFAEVWFTRSAEVTFHDPLAAVSLFEPEICRHHRGRVTISLQAPTEGFTVFTPEDQGPHEIAVEVDAARFFTRYFDTLR